MATLINITVPPPSPVTLITEEARPGPPGPTGPAEITADTPTTLSGLLKGSAGKAAAATPGTDFSAPGHTHLSAEISDGTYFGDPGKAAMVGKVMTVSGTISPDLNGEYRMAGLASAKPRYLSGTKAILWTAGKWRMSDALQVPFWESSEDVATPDLVSSWTPVLGASGSAVAVAAGDMVLVGKKLPSAPGFYAMTSRSDGVPDALHGAAGIADATATGQAIIKLPNPSAVRYLRVNADNTASLLTAAQLAADLAPQLGVPRVLYSSAVKVSRATGNTNLWTPFSWTLPGNTLGPNGWLDINFVFTALNTADAGNRTFLVTMGNQTLKQYQTGANSNWIIAGYLRMWNRNSDTVHMVNHRLDRGDLYWTAAAGSDANGDDSNILVGGAINTAQDQTLEIRLQPVGANDKAYLQAVTVTAYYQA